MIGRGHLASDFRALASHLEHGQDGTKAGRVTWTMGRHVYAGRIADAVPVMVAVSTMTHRGGVESPALHLSAGLDPGDSETPGLLQEIGSELLERIRLGEHQAVLVGHKDGVYKRTGHYRPHAHAMVSLVHPETGVYWCPPHWKRDLERELRNGALSKRPATCGGLMTNHAPTAPDPCVRERCGERSARAWRLS
jgi:hypothetical protein